MSFREVSRQRLLDSYVFDVDRVTLVSDGEEFTRDVVVHPGAVAIVAVNASGCVALLRQWRAPIGGWNIEIPAGTCDVAGEDPAATAQRELMEEVGVRAGIIESLGRFYNSPGWTSQVTYLFLATSLDEVERAPSGPEEVASEVQWWTQEEVRAHLDSRGQVDGTAAIGLRAWLATL